MPVYGPARDADTARPLPGGRLWPVGRTKSWLSNLTPVRSRSGPGCAGNALGQIALGLALILTGKRVKWANGWT